MRISPCVGVRDRMHKTGFSLSIVPSIDQSIVACERACVCACVLQQIHSSLPDLSLWTLTSVIFESVRGKGRKEEESRAGESHQGPKIRGAWCVLSLDGRFLWMEKFIHGKIPNSKMNL